MLNRISSSICNFLYRRKIIKREVIEVYVYGFELMISSIFGIMIVLGIAIALNSSIQGLIFLTCTVSLRLFTGGYHAKSYAGCNVILVLSFLACIWAYKNLQPNLPESITLFCVNETFAILYFPIENKNKPLTKQERTKNKKISLIIIMLYYTIAITLVALKKSVGNFVLTVMCFLFIIAAVELLKRRLEDNEKIHI